MRFSPVLLAFFSASASLSLAQAAQAQKVDLTVLATTSAPDHSTPAVPRPRPTDRLAALRQASGFDQSEQPNNTGPVNLSPGASHLLTPLLVAQLGNSPVGVRLAQTGQDTPDQIRLGPPAKPEQPTTPSVPAETPSAQPTTTPATASPSMPTPPGESKPAGSEAQPSTPSEGAPAPAAPGQPGTTLPTEQPAPSEQTTEPEPQVLVAEVAVQGAEGSLLDEVYRVIRTTPGRTTTRSQLQEDINAIFATGYFSDVKAVPEDTPLGVRVTFEVKVNPTLSQVKVEGTKVLPPEVVDAAFKEMYGKTLNLVELQDGIKQLNKWYQDNGYVLAQVVGSPQVSPDGVVTLDIAEGVVENIQVRFLNKDGDDTDDKGNPIRGRTRDFIITREFQLKPGDVFNRKMVERDLQRVFGLGIFDDVRLSLNPGQDPRQVIVVANVVEKNTGSIAAGAGISSASGLFGTVSYQQQNFGGNNQRLGAEIQIGQRELLFDLSFTDPWIGGDPFRTSYTLNFFRRRTISLIFDGGPNDVDLPNGDTPRVNRTGGGINFTRPLNGNPYVRPQWVASLGLQFQAIAITDADGDISPYAVYGPGNRNREPLSWSGTGRDDLFSILFGIVQDLRNDPLRPTQGSLFRIGTEQWIPVGEGSIFGNRLRAGYSYFIPTRLIRFTKGCLAANPSPSDCPQTFAFNLQAGTVIGDLPPYEAFALGGSNSVRGYEDGDLGSARSFVQATIEYRFPIINIFSGVLFFDAATDFGTQSAVLGDPGGIRGKPGSGFGYGIGVRVQSPLGPLRVDYGINDQGDSQVNFGIGERF